jgi:hypothetical protein
MEILKGTITLARQLLVTLLIREIVRTLSVITLLLDIFMIKHAMVDLVMVSALANVMFYLVLGHQ